MVRFLVSVATLALLTTAQAHAAFPQATPPSRSSARTAAKPAATGPVNITTASAAELEGLPGIGAKTAARIVEYRQKNGPFKKAEELMNVRGVGEKNFLKLKSQITVATAKADHNGQ